MALVGPHGDVAHFAVDTYDEGMLQQLKNLLLVFNMIDVLRLDNLLLLHGLNGELGSRLFLQPRVFDVTEGTCIMKRGQCSNDLMHLPSPRLWHH